MLKLRKVLFPTDFSACAEVAYPYADLFAAGHDAELHILHAILWPGDSFYPSAGYLMSEVDRQQILNRLRSEAESHLDRYRPAPTHRAIEVVQAQVTGVSAAQAILDYTDAQDIDLVVMGTHGRHGLNRVFLGSVAEQVLRHAPCPVLTVRNAADASGAGLVERILVPVDFSEESPALLVVARELALENDAEIELLHVVPDVYMPTVYGIEPIHIQFKEIRERSRAHLDELGAAHLGDVPFASHTAVGDPGHQILDFVDTHRPDLLVISTHGYTGLKRLFMGSTAERVVRSAACPVFTVKSHGKQLVEAEAQTTEAEAG